MSLYKHELDNMLRPLLLFFLLSVPLYLSAESAAAPEQTKVYFISPADGDSVYSPVTIVMGLRGMGIAPAGVKVAHTGHHHLIIDTPLPALDRPIPKDKQHLHFGNGQTEAQIELDPGTHQLQLLLGNFAHIPHSPPIFSRRITITVKTTAAHAIKD